MSEKKWAISFLVIYLLHLFILSRTVFLVWPEMFMYPWLIHKGLVLYRDWLAVYTPGVPYLFNFFYSLLGYYPSSLTIIAYGLITISDLMLFTVAVKIFRKWLTVICVYLFYILWHPIFEGNSIWFDSFLLPLTLLIFYLLTQYFKRQSDRLVAIVSICLSISFLFKQTSLWVFAVAVLFIAFANIQNVSRLLRHLLILVAIPAAIYGGLTLIYNYFGLAKQFLYWSVYYPLFFVGKNQYYQLAPSLPELKMIFPVYFLAGLTGILLLIYRKKYARLAEAWLAIFLTVALSFLAYPRWGLFHLAPALGMAAITIGYLVDLSSRFKQTSKLIFSALILILLLVSISSFKYFYNVRSRGADTNFHNEMKNLAQTVSQNVNSAPFYVFGNYDYLYYYLDRKPEILPWIQLLPVLAETPGVQQDLIKSLETKQIQYIAYFPYHTDKVFYEDYVPQRLWTYIFSKYDKIKPLPHNGWLLKRKS